MIFGNVSTFYTILRITPGEKYQIVSSFKKPTLQNTLKIWLQEWYSINKYKHSMERRPWKPNSRSAGLQISCPFWYKTAHCPHQPVNIYQYFWGAYCVCWLLGWRNYWTGNTASHHTTWIVTTAHFSMEQWHVPSTVSRCIDSYCCTNITTIIAILFHFCE